MDRMDTPHATAGLTTGAVSRRLGVSPTTLRSWDRRYGVGPTARAEGRHRRWTPDDVRVLEEMCRLTATGLAPAEAAATALRGARGRAGPEPSSEPSGQAGESGRAEPSGLAGGTEGTEGARTPAGPAGGAPDVAADDGPWRGAARPGAGSGLPLGGGVRPECRGLARAAMRLDAGAVEQALSAAVATYGLVEAWDEVMMPALRAVGRKWASEGDRYVEVEHLLSWHVSARLRAASVAGGPAGRPVSRADAPPVVLACMPGELHALPLEALAAACGPLGVPLLMLGAAVPAPAVEEAVRRTGPAAVVLWSQSRSTSSRGFAEHLARTAWGVRGARVRPAVLTVGPGWAGAPAAHTHRPSGLAEALALLRSLTSAS
ncbi:MerR family transcriptional regulator [Streptomyces sp. GSL17-111]|uniref:MerR family transcriptional regulator n=1 Tax=Streptomyces sp. GSL17-111 TaxID=3121596 RepID=UPI0030F4638C